MVTGEQEPTGDCAGGRPGERYRQLVRRWRLILRVGGFTDEQAGRLIFAKLLYSRGKLRG